MAWTLYHEMLFYLLFACLIYRRWVGLFVLGSWMTVCAILGCSQELTFPQSFYFSDLNLLFGVGMLACVLTEKKAPAHPMAILTLGAACYIGTAVSENQGQLDTVIQNLSYGFASACLLVSTVTLERQGKIRIWSWLVSLGNASYSIYLVHYLLLSFLAKAFFWTGFAARLGLIPCYLLLPALTLLLSYGFYFLVERPLVRLLLRWR